MPRDRSIPCRKIAEKRLVLIEGKVKYTKIKVKGKR